MIELPPATVLAANQEAAEHCLYGNGSVQWDSIDLIVTLSVTKPLFTITSPALDETVSGSVHEDCSPIAVRFTSTIAFSYGDISSVDRFFNSREAQNEWLQSSQLASGMLAEIPDSLWPEREIDLGGGVSPRSHFVLMGSGWYHVLADKAVWETAEPSP